MIKLLYYVIRVICRLDVFLMNCAWWGHLLDHLYLCMIRACSISKGCQMNVRQWIFPLATMCLTSYSPFNLLSSLSRSHAKKSIILSDWQIALREEKFARCVTTYHFVKTLLKSDPQVSTRLWTSAAWSRKIRLNASCHFILFYMSVIFYEVSSATGAEPDFSAIQSRHLPNMKQEDSRLSYGTLYYLYL